MSISDVLSVFVIVIAFAIVFACIIDATFFTKWDEDGEWVKDYLDRMEKDEKDGDL